MHASCLDVGRAASALLQVEALFVKRHSSDWSCKIALFQMVFFNAVMFL